MAEFSSERRFDIVSFLFYLILVVSAAVSIAYEPAVAFFLTGILIFLLFFFHTKYAVFAYAVYLSLEETILQYMPSAFYLFVKYSGDMMLVLLAVAVLSKLATRKYGLAAARNNPLNLPFVAFIVIALISTAINDVPPLIAFIGIRQLFRFVILYYLIIIISSNEWESKTVRKLFSVLTVVVVIQAALGYVQFALGPGSKLNHLLSPGKKYFVEGIEIAGGGSWADAKGAYGTMLVRNTYGVFLALFVMMFAGMAHEVEEKKQFYKRVALFVIPAVVFSYSRQAVYGMVLGLFVIAYIKVNKRLFWALIFFIMVFALFISQSRTDSPALTEQAGLAAKMASPFRGAYLKWSAKVDRLFVITNFGPKVLGSKYALIGTGPASFGSAVGDHFKYYEGYKKYGIGKMGPVYSFAISDTGFFALLGQFGVLGICAVLWFFGRMFGYLLKLFRRADDEVFRGFILGSLGLIPALLLSNVGYINLELRQISFYFWLLLALTFTYWGKETQMKMAAAGFGKEK